MVWTLIKGLFGQRRTVAVPPNRDFAFQDGNACLSFQFAKMRAVYSCRENPHIQHYEIRRAKGGDWLLRHEDGEEWRELADLFPIYADRSGEIDRAFESFMLSVFSMKED